MKTQEEYNREQGKIMAHPEPGEEVVISGFAGEFPGSRNVYELQKNIFNKVTLTNLPLRWDYYHPDIPPTGGTLKSDIHHFDAGFFGCHDKLADNSDCLSRSALEKSVEAVIDAGLNPADLQDKKCSIFVATCFTESETNVVAARQSEFPLIGHFRSMIAHRIAYHLKLKGNCFNVDTACSSSYFALENAYRAIRSGEVECAIVAGVHFCLTPAMTLQFSWMGPLSIDAVCRPFDKDGNGYVRSETAGVLFLQKAKDAKRVYGELVYCKTNSDGYKEHGITYPFQDSQRALLEEFYDECGIDVNEIGYVEAHGTGTMVGDPVECGAIADAICTKRREPLLIGSVKSNIGHAEPASGIGSLAKVITAFETGMIPPNINYKTPNPKIPALLQGKLQVVVDTQPLKKDYIATSSFGFGGENCHILVKRNPKPKINNGLPSDNIPRLVCVSSRDPEGVQQMLQPFVDYAPDADHIRLLHDVFRKNIPTHAYRGYSIVTKSGEIYRQVGRIGHLAKPTPLCFGFGELTNWWVVNNKMMSLSAYADSMQRTQKYLLDKYELQIFNGNQPKHDTYQVVGSIAVQLAIVDIFKALTLKPRKCYGFCYGELITLHLNGRLSREQLLDSAICINNIINATDHITNGNANGFMTNGNEATNGNCYYGSASEDLRKMLQVNKLKKKKLTEDLSAIIPKNTIIDQLIDTLCGSMSPHVQDIGMGVGLVTLGWISSEHLLEDAIVYGFNPTTGQNVLNDFMKLMGNLYLGGHNPVLANLYPHVEYPVSRGTRMISPYIKWKHDRNYFVPLHIILEEKSGIRTVKIDVNDQEWSWIAGHVIDGRMLFPATGYLLLVWETLGLKLNTEYSKMNVVFEDCRFLRATQLPAKGNVTLSITILVSGKFEICEGQTPVVIGNVYVQKDELKSVRHSDRHVGRGMTRHDVYKELKLRGYNYSGGFRMIQDYDVDHHYGHIKWEDNWASFMDNMLQMKILAFDTRLLYVPTYIQEVVIDASAHIDWIYDRFAVEGKEPNLPACYDEFTGNIRSGGIEIKGLLSSTITRKRDLRVPVLEKYVFVSNETSLDIEESVRVNIQIILENNLVTKVKCVEMIDKFTGNTSAVIAPIVLNVLGDQPLIQPNVTVLSKMPLEGISVPIADKALSTETDCTLIVMSKLSQRSEDLSTVFKSLKGNGFIISREEATFDVSKGTHKHLDIFTVHRLASETVILYRRRLPDKPMNVMEIENDYTFTWLPQLQELTKAKQDEDVVLFSEKDFTNGILGLVLCLRREPETRNVRCVFLMDESDTFDIENSETKQQLQKNMATNVRKDGKWGTYRHMLIKKQEDVEREHCVASTLVRGDLSSFKWFEGCLTKDIQISSEQELVHVCYSSLNFKDVMLATGKLGVDTIPCRLQQDVIIGMEYSGYDRNGDRVMGMVTNGALSNMLLSDKYFVFKVPSYLTMEEAATIPVVYGTLVYGLLHKAKMRRGESILIHSGTGGIGLAAITLALHYGVDIYVTVGTKEKKELLRKMYPQIDGRRIGNSRDITFEQMIMKETKGRGVDIVVNSLAEEKLIAGIRCLAHKGKFVEIGKFDITKNSDLNLQLMNKEAIFIGVALDQIYYSTPEEKKVVASYMTDLLNKGIIKPLSTTVFKMNQVEQAFRYMATGKHTGKVLIQINEVDRNVAVERKKFTVVPKYHCSGDTSQIILGGLGGFGLELADWLILRGARRLVLTSRKGVTTGYQAYRIRTWKSYGVHIHVSTADVTTKAGCIQLINEAQKLGPVESIYNLAVILQDSLFENQTVEKFVTSFGPKAKATRYLDEVSRIMCQNLRDFVIFSSVSCGRGNAGQTNYGMANSVMERICEKRRREGYPALAIEWGAIGEVGLVAEMQQEQHEIEIGGTLQQRISSCLDALNMFLGQNEASVVSSTVVAEKKGVGDGASIADVILFILGVADVKSVSTHSTLSELGMDSMTSVEVKQTLERDFEIFLSPKDLRSMTLARLKEIEAEKYEGDLTRQKTSSQPDDAHAVQALKAVFRIIGDEEDSKIRQIKLESRLKQGDNGPTVLFLPGTEGFVRIMKNMASRLTAHVIGIQYTFESEKFETIQDITEEIMPIVMSHMKKGIPFRLVGYSFGSAVALELASRLESRGYTGTVICVDATPFTIKTFVGRLMTGTSEDEFQNTLCCYLLSFVHPPEFVKQKQEEFKTCKTWDERLSLLVNHCKDVVKFNPEYIRMSANVLQKRLKAVLTYQPNFGKISSHVHVMCASRGIQARFQDESDQTGLSECCQIPVHVETFDTDHVDIIDDEKVAEKINVIIS